MNIRSTSWMTKLDRAAERLLIWVFMLGGVVVGIVGAVVGVVGLVISASIVLVCWRLLRGRPFGRSLTVLVLTLGCVLVFGTTISQGFGGLGRMMAAAELNADEPGFWPLASTLDPTPLFFGLALFMVAVLLQYGERMQRDTEGLV